MTGPGLPGRNYKVICVVGSCLHWTQRHVGEAMVQSEAGFHQYWAWSSSAKGTVHLEAYRHLPATHKVQLLKEPWVVFKLDEPGSQGITRVE